MSSHLIRANQTYCEHFRDSISYSWMSLKSSFYFLVHAINPDFFEKNGSTEINGLYRILMDKNKPHTEFYMV